MRNVAAAYLLTNQNRFKIIAYEKAADAVEHMNREIKDIWQEGKLGEIPGIGPSIESHLNEFFKKGKSKHFESVLSGVPENVFELMKIPTIGPKKAFKLVNSLKLEKSKSVVADLRLACLNGKVAELPTFGKKSQSDILEAIALFQKRSSKVERMPLPYADSLASEIIVYLMKHPLVKRADALGSLRRKVSTIGDIDIAIQVPNEKSAGREKIDDIIKYFIDFPKRISIDNAGEKKASIIISPNIRVDLRIEPVESYGSMLQYFTGSKSHNINLREYALKLGLSLSEYGIKKWKSGKGKSSVQKLYKFEDEEKFYQFLGLPYIPPEIREGTNEIDVARNGKIPHLVETSDIKGDLHIHSSYDLKPSHDLGKNTYRELLSYGKKFGYEYIGFADHNPKTGDLSKAQIVEILKKRWRYLKKVADASDIPLFIGLEADILPDGTLAIPTAGFDYLDYVIVSVHSVFNLGVSEMTKRIISALSYPKVKILGHPTGRLLGSREGYELKWDLVFEACRKKHVAVEINAWPERLDLPDTLVREGILAGVKMVINTDAHALPHMDNMPYGVSVAKRGWCTKGDIMNTWSKKEMREWIGDMS